MLDQLMVRLAAWKNSVMCSQLAAKSGRITKISQETRDATMVFLLDKDKKIELP